jgi:hypothetical protein
MPFIEFLSNFVRRSADCSIQKSWYDDYMEDAH